MLIITRLFEDICNIIGIFNIAFSQDPPRPTIGSIMYQEMAGYMPGRGDFATEYDDFAELDIQHISFDTDEPVWNGIF